jgi:hypothetical protein
MKALSLYQPWASLVMLGAKRVETRSWRTTHRGPLAIHASSRFRQEGRSSCRREPFQRRLEEAGLDEARLPLGVLLGTVRLLDCVPVEDIDLEALGGDETSFGDFTPGRYAWLLADPRPLPVPVPASGRLGVFDLDLTRLAAELRRHFTDAQP